MNLTVNGISRTFAGRTAGELLTELEIKRERVAVVVNEQVIRRANLDTTELNEDDVVEIITMVGGG